MRVRFHGNAILGASHVRDWREVLALVEKMGRWMLQRDVVSALEGTDNCIWNLMCNRCQVESHDTDVDVIIAIYDIVCATLYGLQFQTTICS